MEKPTGARVEFYEDVRGEWRWTQYAENGQIRAASEEGFAEECDARVNWSDGIDEALAIRKKGATYRRDPKTAERTKVGV